MNFTKLANIEELEFIGFAKLYIFGNQEIGHVVLMKGKIYSSGTPKPPFNVFQELTSVLAYSTRSGRLLTQGYLKKCTNEDGLTYVLSYKTEEGITYYIGEPIKQIVIDL